MKTEILANSCHVAMLLIQWSIMALVSFSLLKSKQKEKYRAAAEFVLAGFVMTGIVNACLPVNRHGIINMILCMSIVIGAHVFLFAEEPKRKILLGITESILLWSSRLGASYLVYMTADGRGVSFAYSNNQVPACPEYKVLFVLYAVLICLILFMTLLVLWKGIETRFWMKENLLYVMVPCYQLILIILYYRNCKEIGNAALSIGVALVLISLVIDFSIVYLVRGILRKEQIEKELTALYVQRQAEQKYYEMATDNLAEMKEIRKDYSEQLQVLYKLLEKGESLAELKELLESTSKNLQDTSLKRFCENSIINAILLMKSQLTREKNIDLESECRVGEEIGIEMIDLCSLFANLLDNAIEACEKMQADVPKWISIRAGVRGDYLTVRAENTYSQPIRKEKEIFLTSKKDAVNHGYGLKLIDEIVRKYAGNMQIDARDGIFSAVIVLKKV